MQPPPYVDNQKAEYTVDLTKISNDYYIPIREIAQTVEGEVSWNANTYSVEIVTNNQTITMRKNSNTVYLKNSDSEEEVVITVKDCPIVENGTTYVTPEFVREVFDTSIYKYKDVTFVYMRTNVTTENLLDSARLYDSILDDNTEGDVIEPELEGNSEPTIETDNSTEQ